MALVATPPVARLLASLKDRDVKEKGAYWIARCPAHEDDRHSLSITVGKDGRALVNCHAGCTVDAIAQGAGLSVKELFAGKANGNGVAPTPYKRIGARLVATYDYVDQSGRLLYQACRYEPKDFNQRRPDGRGEWIYDLKGVTPVLYRLPQLIEAIAEERTIYLVEGEKDVATLTELGYLATTWAGGAKAWKDAYATVFRNSTVVCLPDNDEPGRKCMQQAARAITNVGGRVKIVELPRQPEKADVTDWLEAENTLDELAEIEGKAPIWTLDPAQRTRWRLDELWENDAIMRPPPPIVPRLVWRSRSTLLAAVEKSGKSTMAGYVAAQVSRGGPFLDTRCECGTVLIVGLEEFIGDVARRLRRFDADPRRIEIVDHFAGGPAERVSEIKSHMDAVEPVLVIVDTLMAYAEGTIDDATKSSQMQPVVQQLTRLAHESETGLLITHHARRSDGRYRDSSAIGGGVDVIVEVFVPNEDADPTLRRARARGRVPVHGFDFRLDGDTYRLVIGDEAPIELRIVEYVRDHPGTSTNDVTDYVKGNRRRALSTITSLIAGRHLMDESDGKGRRLFVPSSVTGSLIN